MRQLILALTTALMILGCTSKKEPVQRPNILVAIADDWSWPNAEIYGDSVVKTPTFDRIAQEGILFTHAFCAAPTCSASRAAILTGQYPHRLAQGANLWGFLPRKFPNYTRILEKNGYFIGFERKGWAPGNFEDGGYSRNPAGTEFKDFRHFLDSVPKGKPFCYWFGSYDPHRPYEPGMAQKIGLKAENVVVPPFLPDAPEVRNDMLDYYFEVKRFDHEVGSLLQLLEESGQLDNTLVIMTSDNGMPFPRAKANLYEHGGRVPLAMRWKGHVKAGMTVDGLVNQIDLAPTILQAVGLPVSTQMSGKSLLPLLQGRDSTEHDKVFVERERHAYVRKGNLGYPSRAMRTKSFLYIRNFRPDRWPAGNPERVFSVGPFGDVDGGPSKDYILHNVVPLENTVSTQHFYDRAFAKRPHEELYDLRIDPNEFENVADNPVYADTLKSMRGQLDAWMKNTGDPRIDTAYNKFDTYPYYGGEGGKKKPH